MITQILTEKEIVTLLEQKNWRGMNALYSQYSNYIFGLISKIIKMEDVAQIVLQDTFLKIWNKIDSYRSSKGRFITWMINIARNTAIDMLRSKNYKQTLKLADFETIPFNAPINSWEMQIENIDVKEIVHKLAPKYRELIELAYFKGYTHSEIAKEYNIPLGTVKSRIRKAFKDLRKVLER